jgi:L-aminopeptidase/D-esterase-like protein
MDTKQAPSKEHALPNNDSLTAVAGVAVGHWTDSESPTGCTVVLCPPQGAVASCDVRGGAPGTRNTDLLRPGHLVERIHAVLLTGGSEFGHDAGVGVVRWLREHGRGFPYPTGALPVVCGGVIFDRAIGDPERWPGAEAGHAACENASDAPVAEGSVGAGAGATVAKAKGIERALKGGVGTAAERTASGIVVGALVTVNCWGEVTDPESGQVIAGPRGEEPGTFESTIEAMREAPPLSPFLSAIENTTLGVVATDAELSKENCYRLAIMAQAGLARTIRPAHSPVDGDTIFALATGTNDSATDLLQLGTLAARAVERAIVRAVRTATGVDGVPSAWDWAASKAAK